MNNYTQNNNSVNTPDSEISKPQDSKSLNKISILPTEKKYIMVMNETTGTVKGLFPLKSKNLGTGWIALYQNPAGWLAQQRLTGEQYSVLFALFNRLDFENYLRISRQEIADFLSMQPVNVSRAMKKLKELEIIIEGPPAGKFKTYRLNPYIAHKGKERDNTVIDFNDSLKKNNS